MGKTVRGVIIKISGPVLDMRFAAGEEPPINALVQTADGTHHMEVAMQVQAGIVRCVALEATEGLRCGKEFSPMERASRYRVGEFCHRSCCGCARPSDRRKGRNSH